MKRLRLLCKAIFTNFMLICILLLIYPPLSQAQYQISLAGQWNIKLDQEDIGIQEEWYNQTFSNSIQLPGSIQEQDYGKEPSIETEWVATRLETFFEQEKYAPYWDDENFKFPYFLTPDNYYKGVAWFQKEITIPEHWNQKHIVLELERAHWGSTVFVDNNYVGADSSLSIPHRYILSDELTPGNHTLTIRVDNRILLKNIGPEAHSVTDHTQTNWNGLVGELSLTALSPVHISDVQVYPNIKNKEARVQMYVKNATSRTEKGEIRLQSVITNAEKELKLVRKKFEVKAGEVDTLSINYSMGDSLLLWDSFEPNLYTLNASLRGEQYQDSVQTNFGMREFAVDGKRFAINGIPIFLRGTLESVIFPKTGYPSTSKKEWARIFDVIKQHGLNHMRFHSWCPPKAAFEAADEAGIYLQVEASVWARHGAFIGYGEPIDKFVIEESQRILREYGNHPSFVMFAHGNEPAGTNREEYLSNLVTLLKEKDNRRVYTGASGWPVLAENDFQHIPDPRIQRWEEGLDSRINANPPSTDWDFSEIIQKHDKPVVGHEIGQWTVYPNFKEMSKYTGVLEPRNFEIFHDFLKKNHMLHQAHDFLMASGKLQVLCYKADIEGSLRTPDYAGYQMLDLHDYPGQGTALVGILDPFWDSKPYINSAEFSRFSSSTVPLARMEKRVWSNTEMFSARLEVAHFAQKKELNTPVRWRITDSDDNLISKGEKLIDLPIGNNIEAGEVLLDLSGISPPKKLNMEVKVGGIGVNDWDFWVYPKALVIKPPSDIIITNSLTPEIEENLKEGAKILLLLNGKVKEGKGKEVEAGFSTIFWNTVWTRGQAPHTMGVLVDPKNPLLNAFPTEYHTNWQWWDIVHRVHPMILDDFPAELGPTIQMIDTPFNARKLGLLFEGKVGEGKLVITSIDFENNLDERLAARQLYHSLLRYMDSNNFDPHIQLSMAQIRSLYQEP